MKIVNLLIMSLMFFSGFSNNYSAQAVNPECLEHCSEMLSHAQVMCAKTLPFFFFSGPVASLASGGCFAAAWAAYGVCLGYCHNT